MIVIILIVYVYIGFGTWSMDVLLSCISSPKVMHRGPPSRIAQDFSSPATIEWPGHWRVCYWKFCFFFSAAIVDFPYGKLDMAVEHGPVGIARVFPVFPSEHGGDFPASSLTILDRFGWETPGKPMTSHGGWKAQDAWPVTSIDARPRVSQIGPEDLCRPSVILGNGSKAWQYIDGKWMVS